MRMSGPFTQVQMMIRRPAGEVYEAFVDPAITTQFWFSKGSGRLEWGKRVRWDWEMYGVGTDVEVKALEPGRRIVIDWSFPQVTTVEWVFTDRGDGTTMVHITEKGFDGDVARAMDSTQGFSLLLAGAKAWLEHGLALNLVPDKAPDALVRGWRGEA